MANTAQSTKTIYGSGTDLSNAVKNYGNNPGYKFIDTSTDGFDPNSMVSGGYMLGGTGVNRNIIDDTLNAKGITRLSGNNSAGTATALANALGTKFVYGSGNDLSSARNTLGNGYKYVDTSADDFNPNTMVAGSIMLGGNGVNTNVTDNLLNNSGVQRLGGVNSAETTDKLSQYKVNSLMPTNDKFSFGGTMQDYLDQAQTLLQPQLELAQNNINDNYDSNYIPQANNDTLKRGLARSSYAGNRVDQLNTARDKELSSAVLSNLQNSNNLALQNYNTAYDRAFNEYNSGFNNNMALYNAANNGYWQNKSFNQDQLNADRSYNLNLDQYNTSKDQWQQTFDRQGLWHDDSSSSGSSGGSGGSGRSGSSSKGSSSYKSKAGSSQSEIDKAAYANFNSLSSPQDMYAMIHDPDYSKEVSTSMQKSLKSAYDKAVKGYIQQSSDNAAANKTTSDLTSTNAESWMKSAQPTWDYSSSLSNGSLNAGGSR